MLNSILTYTFLLFILPLSALNADESKYETNNNDVKTHQYEELNRKSVDSSRLNEIINNISKQEKSYSLLIPVNKALSLSKNIGFNEGIAKCYFLLGEIYDINKNHRYAAKQFLLARNYFSKCNDRKREADALYSAAHNYESIQESDLAIINYKAAIDIYEEINETLGLSKAYTNLGVIYDYAGDYSNAMLYYVKSYETDRNVNDTSAFSIHFNNIGQIFISLNIDNKGIEYLNKSVDYAINTKDSLTLSYAYVSLNNVYLNMNKLDLAHKYITYAIDIQNQLKDKDYDLLSIAYTDLARVYTLKQDYNKAKTYLTKSYNIALKEELVYPQLYALAYTAQLYNSLKEYTKAESTINKALETYNGYKMIPIKITILNHLKETYSKQSLFEKAYKIQEEIYNLNKVSTYESHVKNISEVSASLDISQEQKINDIKINQQREALLGKIEKQKIIIFFTILVLTSMGILAFNSIKNHKIQKEINNALLLKNQEIEANRLEINKQSEALSQLNEHKDLIFTIVSHDLRKPIAHLSSVLELLENNLIDEKDLQAMLPKISKNVKDTSQVLDSLLVWAKSQLKGFNLKITENNLFNFVNNRIQTLLPFATEKNIKIINQIDPELNIRIDALLTTIIIRNFVLNAIKFSNESQSITISSKSDENFHYIFVKDEGIGMSKQQLETLFGPQTKSTLGTKKEKGTGLGLVFCKDLVEKSGGKLTVKSAPNKGTTISFSIPVYS